MAIDDETPFGKTFNRSILEDETVQIGREYAKTGSPINESDSPEVEKTPIDRVEFDYSQFDKLSDESIEDDEDDEDDSFREKTMTEHNSELDSDEVTLNKKVQADIAKSQAKNIVGMYIMLLRACWKWIAKIDESKINMLHAKGQLDINTIISNHPLIYHIKNMNSEVDEWDIDEDQEDAIIDALKIYMVSKNIQTSPGMNLAMAMGVPAVEMIGRAISHKKSINTLINSVTEMHKSNNKKIAQLKQSENLQNQILQQQIDETSQRNAELMQTIESQNASKKQEAPKSSRTVRKNSKSGQVAVKKNVPAIKVEPKAESKTA